MTDDSHDSTDGSTAAENETDDALTAGDVVTDAEDNGTLVVIADTGRVATQHEVAAAGETVAELNPEYPPDDAVLFATYRDALDSTFGETWRAWDVEYLAFQVGDRGVPVYSFPESRLEQTDDDAAGEEGVNYLGGTTEDTGGEDDE